MSPTDWLILVIGVFMCLVGIAGLLWALLAHKDRT